MGFFEKLKEGLKKTKEAVFKQVTSLFSRYTVIDDDLYEELEEILITSDVGVGTTEQILESLQEAVRRDKITEPEDARLALMKILAEMIGEGEPLNLSTSPAVVLVIGVNGVGKTTTIGKLAARFKAEGKNVILGAADTFRAAAVEQLQIWADRAGVGIVRQEMGSDPASVAYDTVKSAVAKNADVVIIDTAGRLHNRINLMNELTKIRNVIRKVIPDAPHEVMLVLDGSTGQNAYHQAQEFSKATDVTSLAVTKLDGSAKGGVVIGIVDQMKIPIKFIGIGEGIDDLKVFDKKEFAASLFNPEDIAG